MDEIKVSVFSYPDRANLVLGYVDPVSGKRKTKSAGTSDPGAAERAAGEWEKELRTGRYQSASKLTWREFRQRYEAEKGPMQSVKTQAAFKDGRESLGTGLEP